MTKESAMAKQLDDETVLAFLKANPDFLNTYPDVLDHMTAPGGGKGVVDFQKALVERLKTDKSRAQKLQKELIENARANMNNLSRIQTAILVALEAHDFESLVEALTQDLPALLDVDTINLIVETASKEIPFVNQSGIRFAKTGTIFKWLNTGDVLLQGNISGHEEMFGPGAGLVRSQALVKLEVSEKTQAILAFGSRDPLLFQPDQAIDQIGFLAQVIERCLRIWLDPQG